MDEARKNRLLRDLRDRFRDAQIAVMGIPDNLWDRLVRQDLEQTLFDIQKAPASSREGRFMRKALVLLHPHREAWNIVGSYRTEILEAEPDEQEELLSHVIDVIIEESRASWNDIQRHIYAFWPVPIAGARM